VFFRVRDLEIRAGRFDVEIPPGTIDFLDPKIRQGGPLKARGTVELSAVALGEIRVKIQAERIIMARRANRTNAFAGIAAEKQCPCVVNRSGVELGRIHLQAA